MIDMNYRRNPFSATFTPEERTEIFQIPASKIIQLSEWPLYSDTTIDRPQMKYLDTGNALTETFSPTPGTDQFCVDYVSDPNVPQIADREGTGRVIVNATTGTWVIVRYWGIGRVNFRQPIADDGIGYPYGLTENMPETILDYRGFTGLDSQLQYPLSTYIIDNVYYTLAVYRPGALDLGFVGFAGINLNAPTLQMPANHIFSPTAGNFFKIGARVFSFLTSENRIGVIWTSGTNLFQGKISTNPLNTTDMGGWTNITFPTAFNQYACSAQIGNQVFFFGCNGVLNTPSNVAVRYNADTQSGVLLASLPNNWQYGACEYDGNGNIWIFGNMLTGQVGQVLKYSIWDNTYETKTAITFPLSFGTGTNNALYFGAIPNGGVLLNQEQNGFIVTISNIRYVATIGFIEKQGFSNEPKYFYQISDGAQKQIQTSGERKNSGYVGSENTIAQVVEGEEKNYYSALDSYHLPANTRLFSQCMQVNKYQNGIFVCGGESTGGPSLIASGRTTIIRNTIKG